uniref:Major facilitator superfamily (MFS) profile domain-containing protein n=1 Tax=Graphocephala atropunctata TaxID=36148 RepID=A0A1B6LYD2_9HEMI
MIFHCGNSGFWYQIFAGISVSLGAFASSSLLAWVTPILPHLLSPNSEIPMTPEEVSWMVSIPELANLITPIPAGLMANRLGRKPMILGSAPLFTLGWAIIIYYKSYNSLLIARCIQGAAVGIVYTVVPVYLGEIAGTDSRGAITSLFFIMNWMGYLFEYCTGPFLSFDNYTLLTLATTVLYFLLVWILPESPYYCLMRGDRKEAYKSLMWFRRSTDELLRKEFDMMTLTIDEDQVQETSWTEVVSNPADRKALYLILFAGSLRILSGTMPLLSYATETFQNSPDPFIAPKYITMVLGLVLVFGAGVSFFTLDLLGRRSLLIISSLGSSIALCIAGTFYFLETKTTVDISQYSWVAPVAILVYAAVDVGGLYPVNTAYTSELFKSNTRAVAASIATLISTFFTFITLKFYQTLIDLFGIYFNFFIFSGLCLIGAIISYFIMPETKNKTFSQIRKELVSSRNKIC